MRKQIRHIEKKEPLHQQYLVDEDTRNVDIVSPVSRHSKKGGVLLRVVNNHHPYSSSLFSVSDLVMFLGVAILKIRGVESQDFG